MLQYDEVIHMAEKLIFEKIVDKSALSDWDCFEDVKRDIDDWFDYYNHDR